MFTLIPEVFWCVLSTVWLLVISVSTMIIIVRSRSQFSRHDRQNDSLQRNAANRMDKFHKLVLVVATVSCVSELVMFAFTVNVIANGDDTSGKFLVTVWFFQVLNSTTNFPIYCMKHCQFRNFCTDIRKWIMKVAHVADGASQDAPVFSLEMRTVSHANGTTHPVVTR